MSRDLGNCKHVFENTRGWNFQGSLLCWLHKHVQIPQWHTGIYSMSRHDKCWEKVAYNLGLIQKYLQIHAVDQPVLPGVVFSCVFLVALLCTANSNAPAWITPWYPTEEREPQRLLRQICHRSREMDLVFRWLLQSEWDDSLVLSRLDLCCCCK